jgi:mannose-6-phosphate isomerase
MEVEKKVAQVTEETRPFPISGVIQRYAWGREPQHSIIGGLTQNGAEKRESSNAPSECYAELWFGAHPKGPSNLIEGDASRSLLDIVTNNPREVLGENVAHRYAELPFLFKVLSIARALSIQAHPDENLAIKLHAADPAHYPDARHKPEVGVALSPVSLLYGFCPLTRTLDALVHAPLEEFFGKALLSVARADPSPAKRKELFGRCFAAKAVEVQKCTSDLLTLLSSREELSDAEQWFVRLTKDYPLTDVGLFGVFFLNLVTLSPGEAVFIGPNIPHAYLEGELIECMANSDNVVRSGLTGKFCDVPTLFSMLSFEEQRARRITPVTSQGICWYRAPAEEFMLGTITGPQEAVLLPSGVPSLCVVLEGNASLEFGGAKRRAVKGQAFFIPARSEKVTLSLESGFVALATCPTKSASD